MSTRVLIDPATGEQFEVDVPDGPSGNGQDAADQGQQQQAVQAPPLDRFQRSPQAIEKQLDIFLFNRDKPDELRKRFWALSQKIAVTKIADPAEYYRFKLRLENVLRAPFLANEKSVDETSILNMELLDFDAMIDMARSVAYDDHPTERELWTMYQLIQKQRLEQHPIQPQSSGSLLGAVASRIFGRGDRRR